METRLLTGDCRDVLKTLPDGSVHSCITSPPYYGLRDYGVDRQIGLEGTPEAYVSALVDIFREVRRVLRDDGTLWLNLGDSYATGGGKVGSCPRGGAQGEAWKERGAMTPPNRMPLPGLKPKDLVGIPWRVAFALQADGWYLRQDIIWSKPNPMPESIVDRCTKSHEYVFLLTKKPRYFYDYCAIMEDAVCEDPRSTKENELRTGGRGGKTAFRGQGQVRDEGAGRANREGREMRDVGAPRVPRKNDGAGTGGDGTGLRDHVGNSLNRPDGKRNKRSVWTINTRCFREAHFATFPPDLVRPMILAGCPEKACSKCGAPWIREVEKSRTFESGSGKSGNGITGKSGPHLQGGGETIDIRRGPVVHSTTLGFSPSCDCGAEAGAGTVLDPFSGSGTVSLVAESLGRNSIGIELNPKYVKMARRRTSQIGCL